MRVSTRNPPLGPRSLTRRIVRHEAALRAGQTTGREGGKSGSFFVYMRFLDANGVDYEIALSEAELAILQKDLEDGKANILKYDEREAV